MDTFINSLTPRLQKLVTEHLFTEFYEDNSFSKSIKLAIFDIKEGELKSSMRAHKIKLDPI